MSKYHHQSASIVSKFLLSEWRDGNDLNSFISKTVTFCPKPPDFPSPDANYEDDSTQSKISIEFKPIGSSKGEIMKGLGQSIAYLKRADASYLVAPSKTKDFPMGPFLKDLFEKYIYGKLSVGLVLYDGEFLEDIRIECNIANSLTKGSLPYEGSKVSYWAIWRELSHLGIYYLIKSASIENRQVATRKQNVWDYFFDNYYAPPQTRINLDPIPNDIYHFGMTETIPFKTIKQRSQEIIDNNESYESIINSFKKKKKNSDQISDRTHYCINLSEKNTSTQNANQLFENRAWSKNVKENIYANYLKNFTNIVMHLNFFDVNFNPSALAIRYAERCEAIINNKILSNDKKKIDHLLCNELASVFLVSGSHDNLITDIKTFTKKQNKIEDEDKYLSDLYDFFDKSGYIAKNPERSNEGTREFLDSEKGLWFHLGLIKKNGRNFFFPGAGYVFDDARIEDMLDFYYKNYSDIASDLENE
jgi:hypothetical protein